MRSDPTSTIRGHRPLSATRSASKEFKVSSLNAKWGVPLARAGNGPRRNATDVWGLERSRP